MALSHVFRELDMPSHRLNLEMDGARNMLGEPTFKRMIAIERKRTERTGEPFLLMLLEAGPSQHSLGEGGPLDRVANVLLASSRETDVIGWYVAGTIIGVIYTGLVVTDRNAILGVIFDKVNLMLRNELTNEQFSQVSVALHLFPDNWGNDKSGRPSDPALYPDLTNRDVRKRSVIAIKRVMDIVVSAICLIVSSPMCAAIAVAIKASSKGPVLYKQERIGRHGSSFMMLKFRSMYIDNDHKRHKDYVTKFIVGQSEPQRVEGNSDVVYKLSNDKRITLIGNFLRKTSLDELPQFLNVLRGEMALVGPRPPLPYEVEVYQTWHRRRVLEVKPGITGLWQVSCRSRVKFDEMVRLDLRYATSWTPWMDFKILLRTPLVMIRGDGAC